MLVFELLHLFLIMRLNPETKISVHSEKDKYILTILVRIPSDEDITIPDFLKWDKTSGIIYFRGQELCKVRFDYHLDASLM